LPSWPFTVVVLGTQVIALILSVYGVVGDARVEGIGWVRGIIIVAIALVTFVLVDLVKVLTIHLWNKNHSYNTIIKKKPTLSSPLQKLKQGKKSTRAQKFNQEHALQWDEQQEGYRGY
jgi:H+-transporting ATPase